MIFDPILDIFRGKAVTIPPMDGALKPNTALDDAAMPGATTAIVANSTIGWNRFKTDGFTSASFASASKVAANRWTC